MQTQIRKNDALVIMLAFVCFITLGMPGGMLGVAWASMRDTFEVPPEALGTLLGASSAGFLLASFFSGRVIARLGIGWTVIGGTLLSAVSLLGYGLLPTWLLIVAVSVVRGMGAGTLDAGLNLHFARTYSPRILNWLHASFGLGAALGPLIITWLVSAGESWRWGYFLLGVAQLLLLGVFFLSRAQWQIGETPERRAAAQRFSMRSTLAQPLVWFSILLFFVYAGVEVAAGQWSFDLFTVARGIDVETAGLWVSIYWASFTIGRILFGFIAGRIAIIPTIRLCMLGVIGGTLLLAANIGAWSGFVGLAVIGFGLAPIFPLLISTTPARLGHGHASNAIGFQVAAADLGIAVIPGFAGVLASASGFEIIGPYLVGFAILMLILFQVVSTRQLSASAQMAESR